MATLESLQAQIKKLEQQAEALIANRSSAVIEKIREMMSKHGLTIGDVDAHGGGKRSAKKSTGKLAAGQATSVAKYQDPKTGDMWSGHGRAPAWIAIAKNRDKFLIDGSAVAANVMSTSKAKAAGNYVRGPQPAMYRHPKSGATWSGRGRAPAWIAEARDRTRFLISDAAETNVATTDSAGNAKAVSKKVSKIVKATTGKGQPRGLQPAKYLDSKTGATWSGRGRAPAWIAGARDRLKFLIDASETATTTGGAEGATRKSGATKLAATNAVTKKVDSRDATVAKKTDNSKKAARQKVIAARKKVGAKKSVTQQVKRPVSRKLAANKTPAVEAVVTSSEVAVVPKTELK